MRVLLRRVLEYVGIGVFILSVPAIFVYLFIFAVRLADEAMSPLVTFLFGGQVRFIGFLFLMFLCGLLGAIVRSEFGWRLTKSLVDRVILLKLIVHGARSGALKRALRSRDKDAPNTILAPYYRTGGLWPFVILRIVETTDQNDPLIWGTFIDLPFIYKPYTVNANDYVFADITFDEGLLFAFNGGGIGVGDNPRKPRKVLLGDYLKEHKFREFMEATA